MVIKLLVRQVGETREPTEHAFRDQDAISIGRDGSADLTLLDDQLMVSRLHAQLEKVGGLFQLTDMGSRNFSTIRGEQLVPGQFYPLSSGDVFHIANFEVQFVIEDTPAVDFGETRFETGFENPFLSHVTTLLHVTQAIQLEYDKLPPVRKDAALAEAMESIRGELGNHPVFGQLASISGVAPGIAPSVIPPSPGMPQPPPLGQPSLPPFPAQATPESYIPPVAQPAVPSPDPYPPAPRMPMAPGRLADFIGGNTARLDKLLDMVIGYVSRQVKIPWQFRYEFIGHTFIPTADSKAIYDGDQATLTAFLFNEGSDQAELDRRFELIEDALEESLVHQVAMLDGYRAAVNAGTLRLIDELDPTRVAESLENEGGIFKKVAVLNQAKAYEAVLAQHAEVKAEDISVLERRTYRPSFIKSYLERTASARDMR